MGREETLRPNRVCEKGEGVPAAGQLLVLLRSEVPVVVEGFAVNARGCYVLRSLCFSLSRVDLQVEYDCDQGPYSAHSRNLSA